MADRGARTPFTPTRVLVAFAIVVVGGVLLSPPANPESGGRLTTFASDGGGTRGFFETLQRLGWSPDRTIEPLAPPLDSNAIYMVLDPIVPLTSGEVTALLEAVRDGAGLVVAGGSSAIHDSLGLRVSSAALATLFPANAEAWDSLGVMYSTRWPLATLRLTDSTPPGTTSFLNARRTPSTRAPLEHVAIGVPFGRGRIAVLSDGAVMANRSFRAGMVALLPVRLVEWVAPGERRSIVFAEYHQGHGHHASIMGSVRRALATTPPGRALVALLASAGVLLLAVGIRPLAPRSRARVQRRSPIEHVGALAQAYSRIGAARTATRRLVYGLRRRHPIGTLRTRSDDEYLSSLAARYPAVAPEAALLRSALADPPAGERIRDVAVAVATIEGALET